VNGGRVLVIEDDPGIARVLRRGLTLQGLDVTVVEEGTAGRAAWGAAGFDVVILDVMLPGVDGIELCKERRAAGDRTPVLLLTAREDDTVRARGTEAGADAFLGKPFAYADLLTHIQALLRRSERPAP
jgi:DNA-binding response OmpR family regulator